MIFIVMTIDVIKNNGLVEGMNLDEFTRWMCLMEAFHVISQKAEELKVDVFSMIKPLAIDVYIKERFDSMKHGVQCEHELGNL